MVLYIGSSDTQKINIIKDEAFQGVERTNTAGKINWLNDTKILVLFLF